MPKPPRTAVFPSPNGSHAKPNLGPGVTRCTFVMPCGTPGAPAICSPSKGLPTPGTSAPIKTAGDCAPVIGLTASRTPAAFRPGRTSQDTLAGFHELGVKADCIAERWNQGRHVVKRIPASRVSLGATFHESCTNSSNEPERKSAPGLAVLSWYVS